MLHETGDYDLYGYKLECSTTPSKLYYYYY